MFMLYLGNINSIYSEGTNQLIKEGAKLYTSILDLEWDNITITLQLYYVYITFLEKYWHKNEKSIK